MSRQIMISIKPKWCDLIFSGEKIDEIRRTKPKTIIPYQRVLIYRTGNGGVVGRFLLRDFTYIQAWKEADGTKHLGNTAFLQSCLTNEELFDYLYKEPKPEKPYPGGWAWRIEELEKFDKPYPLSYFGLKRPPQSWCYVDVR